VSARIAGVLDLGSSERKVVRWLCDQKADRAFHPRVDRGGTVERRLTLHRVSLRDGAPNQPGLRVEVFVPGFLRDRARQWLPQNLAFNAAMNRAEFMTEIDELLSFLREIELEWQRLATEGPSRHRRADA